MAITFKFPIRYKILIVLSAVVMAAVAVYLYLASRVFYEDKTVLIYELNETNVRTLAADVRTGLERVLDKLKLMTLLTQAGTHSSSENNQTLSAIFSDEGELVHVAILRMGTESGTPVELFSQTWPKYLESYKKDASFLTQVRASIPIPFAKVLERGVWVRSATLPGSDNPPLMVVATAIDVAGTSEGARFVAYADVRLDRTLEALVPGGIARTSIIDSEGHVLARSEQLRMLRDENVSSDPLVRAAISSKVRSEVRRFEEGGHAFLGSYYQVGLGGLVVVSRVEAGEAFQAAERLVRKSLIYALVIVTAAFLIALLFSHSLTAPIQRMVEATQRIAKGDFNRFIHISSHDELANLAASFNSMTADLKSSREQIEEYSRDLEKKVQDRTSKLEAQNIAIKEAQEALVRTTRLASVGEIAGRAAHEVLNPLTNIAARLEKMQSSSLRADSDDVKLFSEIVGAWVKDFKEGGPDGLIQVLASPSETKPGANLLDEDLGNLEAISSDLSHRQSERQSDIEFLLKEAGRINKIVNSMRQLTRVSGNRKPLFVHQLLDEALATMNDVLKKHKISTETRYASGSPQILADHDELLQVFSNLIRNSMQAIDAAVRSESQVGSPAKVWLETQLVDADVASGKVLIRVCDNGPGILEENFQKVFEASFTTKPAEEGTGLGLSISRRFIRALDGEIIVEKSTPGVETVFLIELPLFVKDEEGQYVS